MGDDDGSHSLLNMTHELTQNEPDEPGSRHIGIATAQVSPRQSFQA
jgi:hypothetical protein